MKCSLGMLCQPLRALGLHSHSSSSTRKTARPAAKKSRTVKAVAKKAAPKKVAKKAVKAKAAKKKRK